MYFLPLTILSLCGLLQASSPHNKSDHSFDVIVFSQQWPLTFCIYWKIKKKANNCLIKNVWSIHGIWPTRDEHGPSYCNTSATLDMDALKPIKTELDQNWYTGKGDESNDFFWKYEWLKHGTCARQVDELNAVEKYFSKALAWAQLYNITDIFAEANITAGTNYDLTELHAALKMALIRVPNILCQKKRQTFYLSEIRICFNKQLELMDCKAFDNKSEVILDTGDKVITNCGIDNLISYPNSLPDHLTNISSPFNKSIDHSFDVLIFAQNWPTTFCINWMNRKTDNVCVPENAWQIHGLWPTRYGQLKPNYCNQSAKLEFGALAPIKERLQLYWPSLGRSNDEFWNYEWRKHGTCADEIDALDTPNEYFSQGLAWLQEYNMTKILAKSNIIAGAKYNLTDVYLAIRNTLNRKFSIHCQEDRRTNDNNLHEIRICFNKQLELADCKAISKNIEIVLDSGEKIISNCGLDKLITYPNTLPNHLLERAGPHVSNKAESTWKFAWLNFDYLLETAKWIIF